jgi:rsbT co-antagonist protein RsbR
VQDILEGVELRRAHTVLLDVTGLPVIDTLAARTLLDAAVAVQLLGARLILVGIAPAVAQTIVGLGIDLRNLRIERDLQSAVERVLVSQAVPL